jgi:hypothetical protein
MHMRSFAMACPYCVSLTDGEWHEHLHFNVKLLKKCNFHVFCSGSGSEFLMSCVISFCKTKMCQSIINIFFLLKSLEAYIACITSNLIWISVYFLSFL